MQTLTNMKTKGQEGLNRLVETGKQQSPQTKLWGVTIASAVAGGVAVAALASGVLTVLSVLASPPVALTVGALGGGALGWSFMKGGDTASQESSDAEAAPSTPDVTPTEVVDVSVAPVSASEPPAAAIGA